MFAAFRNQSALLTMAKSKQSSLQTTVLTDNLRIDSVYDFSNRLACVAAGPRSRLKHFKYRRFRTSAT